MSPRSSVTFSKSKSFNSVFISIFNDDQLELPESCSISLSHHEGESVLILPIKSTIWILDNDGMFLLLSFQCTLLASLFRCGNWLSG